MKILEQLSCELYSPYGETNFYQTNDRILFITKMDNGIIYDISYCLNEWLNHIDYEDLLIKIRKTGYRVCEKSGLDLYLKKNGYNLKY